MLFSPFRQKAANVNPWMASWMSMEIKMAAKKTPIDSKSTIKMASPHILKYRIYKGIINGSVIKSA